MLRPSFILCSKKNLVMYILGISAFYHDSGACLLKDGEIIAAAQEERELMRIPNPESAKTCTATGIMQVQKLGLVPGGIEYSSKEI